MSEADRSPLLAARHDASLGVSVVQARSERQWAGARASVGVLRGAFRFEARVADEGLVRVGWSAAAASLEGFGTDPFGFGFGGTGKKSNAGKFEAYGEPFGKGDVIGCFIDRTTTKKGGGGGGKPADAQAALGQHTRLATARVVRYLLFKLLKGCSTFLHPPLAAAGCSFYGS